MQSYPRHYPLVLPQYRLRTQLLMLFWWFAWYESRYAGRCYPYRIGALRDIRRLSKSSFQYFWLLQYNKRYLALTVWLWDVLGFAHSPKKAKAVSAAYLTQLTGHLRDTRDIGAPQWLIAHFCTHATCRDSLKVCSLLLRLGKLLAFTTK